MQNVQKFSISQSINYAFRTYVRNFRFFLKIFGIGLIGSIIFYFGQTFMPQVFSGEFGFLKPIALFCWQLILDVLILNSYDNSTLLRFKNFLNTDFDLGYYLLSYVLMYCIIGLPFIVISLLGFSIVALAGVLIAFCLSSFLFLEYYFVKYLILDKNLTFMQSIRATPDLVYGEKIKLLGSWFVGFVLTELPLLLLYFLGSYFIFGSLGMQYLTIISFPFSIAFVYPIVTMMYISIYKQLVLNADENFKNTLVDLEKFNQPSDDEEL